MHGQQLRRAGIASPPVTILMEPRERFWPQTTHFRCGDASVAGVRYSVLLMRGDEAPESGAAQIVSPHAADLLVARRIADGDDVSWKSFLVAMRPVITRAAIEWCHRISPGGVCRRCAAGAETECSTFSDAELMIRDRVRKGVMAAYNGQASLPEFTESLVCSHWWFLDFAECRLARSSILSHEPPAEQQHQGLVQAWAILAGSKSAWEAFLGSFNAYVEKTAISWCHRVAPSRVCRKCKPGVDHDCDAFGEAYLYLLERLRTKALAAYRGGNSLRSFVFLCLHDHRWWLSFVQKETGKVKIPRALKGEAEVVQQIYLRLNWGWDNERIAAALRLSREDVARYRERVELKLREAGSSIHVRSLHTVSLSAVSLNEEDAGEGRIPELASGTVSPDVRAEAIRFWQQLSAKDRAMLRLRVADNVPVEEVAATLGITASQVYEAIYRIRKQMPEWFRQ